MNIFESSLNQNNLVKKVFCTKERLKAQQHANFLGDQESVFSYDFIVPGIVHFLFFLKFPRNCAFLVEGIAN